MDRQWLEQGMARYGTPTYIFNIDELKENIWVFRKILDQRAHLCFAMKANPFLVGQMAAEMDRIEVCSMGEFRICRDKQIPAGKILISGVLKTEENLREILETYGGKCGYTIESPGQFRCLAEWGSAHREQLRVYLRLTSGNQFGMDQETIESILSARKQFPYLKIQGIHYFSGTQKRSVEKIEKELAWLDGLCLELEEKTGCQLEELEYGPGLKTAYFQDQRDTAAIDLTAIAEAVERMHWKGVTTLEMGRALVACCGYYLTKVRDIKQNDGKNYCIVDGGIHQLHYDGQIRGMYQPYFSVSPECEIGQEKQWTVCGALCTTNDILMQKAMIRDLRQGSILIFERAGAYAMTEGMALFLSHAFPKVVFYCREMGWKQVRKETDSYIYNMEEETDDERFDEYFESL